MTGEDDTRVSYSVKELIEKLDRKIDTVLTALHAKADTSRVQALEARMDGVETTLATLAEREAVQEKQETRHTQRRQWAVDALAALLLVAATIGLMLATMH